MKTITMDYETFFDKKAGHSVTTQGNWAYTHDERFDPYLVSVYDGEDSWVGHPNDLNYSALEGCRIVAHNAGFERAINARQAEKGLAPADLGPYSCTADMTAHLFSERALKNALRVAEGVIYSKELRDSMDGKGWFDIPAATKKAMSAYCLDDTVKTHNLFTKYSPKWSDFEQRLSELTRLQCARGVAIDTDLLYKYLQTVQEALFVLVKSLPWVADGGKPTSTKAIADECRKYGIPSPPVKSHDEEGFEAWVEEYGSRKQPNGEPQFPWIHGVGEWRKLNKVLTSLETIRDRLRPDGTIDFSLLYFGGHTGRWSGGGSGFNMQNIRKDPLVILFREFGGISLIPFPALSAATDPSVLEHTLPGDRIFVNEGWAVVIDMRALLIPRPGKKFIICDLAQIEPRVLNWLAGNKALLELISSGGFSYYEGYMKMCEPNLGAGWDGKPGTLKKFLGGKNYTLLKNKALGLGFQMGKDRFMEYAGVPADVAAEAVKSFREANPLIQQLWNSLDLAFRNSVGGDFILGLPSGREMIYRKVERAFRHKVNPATGQVEKRQVHTAKIGWETSEFYGGILTENITQATARDVFGTHLLALEEQIGDVVFHVHDEAIVECDLDVDPKDVEQVMSVTPIWLDGCPVAAEAQNAMRYLK